MNQANIAWGILTKYTGAYIGSGVNHDNQKFSHRFSMDLISANRVFEISATAIGEQNEVYHSEKSWLGFDPQKTLVLFVTSSNHGTITPHILDRIEESEDCQKIVFRYGVKSDKNSFREEITFSLFSDGTIDHQYAWGLPGGDFLPRSSARVRCTASLSSG